MLLKRVFFHIFIMLWVCFSQFSSKKKLLNKTSKPNGITEINHIWPKRLFPFDISARYIVVVTQQMCIECMKEKN